MAIDDVISDMESFEFEGATKLTPREYGRLRGMAPQLVYYYIRNGVIEVERCICGRKVIDVEQTDKVLQAKKEARGQGLHTDDTV